MARGLAIAACLVLGCGATPAEPPGTFVVPQKCAQEKPEPPPPYAGLFVAGAEVHYDIARTHDFAGSLDASVWHRDGDWMTCRVTEVVPRLGPALATIAKVDCEDNDCDACSAPEWFGVGLGSPPSGRYIATAAGLWYTPWYGPDDDVDAIIGKLDPEEALLDAVPRARVNSVAHPTGSRPESYEVAQRSDGSWCWTHREGMFGDIRCFDRDGLVAGGSIEGSEAVRFERKR